MPKLYLKKGRLSDVLALIQVLSFGKEIHRSNKGLEVELRGLPKSAKSWDYLAIEHPEFFRVNSGADTSVSLLARHISKK